MQPEDPGKITAYVKEWFDLERNIQPFYKLMREDADLAPLAKTYRGLRLVGIPDFFEVLCWCIIGQQINLTFAYTVKRRLVEKYGSYVLYQNKKYFAFPRPEIIAGLSVDELKKLQLTTRKAEYLVGVAQQFVTGKLSKDKILSLPDEDQMRAKLMEIRGIGEWTANYALMKGLLRMNCIPYGDSGINQALLHYKNIPKKNNRAEVDMIFGQFENWKSYLVYYLWRSLRN